MKRREGEKGEEEGRRRGGRGGKGRRGRDSNSLYTKSLGATFWSTTYLAHGDDAFLGSHDTSLQHHIVTVHRAIMRESTLPCQAEVQKFQQQLSKANRNICTKKQQAWDINKSQSGKTAACPHGHSKCNLLLDQAGLKMIQHLTS